MPLFPVLLIAHIALAITLFLPSLLLPFALRSRHEVLASRGRFVRGLVRLEARSTVGIGSGVAATGVALIVVEGAALLRQTWLLAGVSIYAVGLAIAFFVQRPSLRRLFGFGAQTDDLAWAARARRQRYVSYVMAAMIGSIGFLMSAKPQLW